MPYAGWPGPALPAVPLPAVLPFSGRGIRARLLIRSSSATMIQFVTTEEPPCARNGIAIPVSGISPITPPAITKTWRAGSAARPTASRLPKGSRNATAAR